MFDANDKYIDVDWRLDQSRTRSMLIPPDHSKFTFSANILTDCESLSCFYLQLPNDYADRRIFFVPVIQSAVALMLAN